MGLCTTSKVITATERSERSRTIIQRNREWVTIVEFIGSRGCHIPPLIILKGKEQQATWYQESTLPKEWRIATSPNGWTTDIIGFRWLKEVFEPYSKQYSTGASGCLFLVAIAAMQLPVLIISVLQERSFLYTCLSFISSTSTT